MISSEWGAPNTFEPGFNLEDVAAGRYGHSLNFWNLEKRTKTQTVDLGESGMIPLEIRWQHNPDSEHGFVGAALSSTMWHVYRNNGSWASDQVIAIDLSAAFHAIRAVIPGMKARKWGRIVSTASAHSLVASRFGEALPLGTLVINLSGSFLLGLLAGLSLSGNALVLAGTATLGSYTTFSTWMLDTWRLGEGGRRGIALLNVLVSIGLGLGAVALGRAIGGG